MVICDNLPRKRKQSHFTKKCFHVFMCEWDEKCYHVSIRSIPNLPMWYRSCPYREPYHTISPTHLHLPSRLPCRCPLKELPTKKFKISTRKIDKFQVKFQNFQLKMLCNFSPGIDFKITRCRSQRQQQANNVAGTSA